MILLKFDNSQFTEISKECFSDLIKDRNFNGFLTLLLMFRHSHHFWQFSGLHFIEEQKFSECIEEWKTNEIEINKYLASFFLLLCLFCKEIQFKSKVRNFKTLTSFLKIRNYILIVLNEICCCLPPLPFFLFLFIFLFKCSLRNKKFKIISQVGIYFKLIADRWNIW